MKENIVMLLPAASCLQLIDTSTHHDVLPWDFKVVLLFFTFWFQKTTRRVATLWLILGRILLHVVVVLRKFCLHRDKTCSERNRRIPGIGALALQHAGELGVSRLHRKPNVRWWYAASSQPPQESWIIILRCEHAALECSSDDNI
jgi:hypothetical protein